MIKLKIIQHGPDSFEVQPVPAVGACIVGRGTSIIEAIGSYFHHAQEELGIEFVLDKSAVEAEMARREDELAKR